MMDTAKSVLARVWTGYGAYLWLASTSILMVLFLASCARVMNVSRPVARSSGNQQKVSEADRNMDINAICASVKRACAEKGL
jgi:heme exporter protein D